MKLTIEAVNEYLEFKIKQFIRTTGFDSKQENAKKILKASVRPFLKQWVRECNAAHNG